MSRKGILFCRGPAANVVDLETVGSPVRASRMPKFHDRDYSAFLFDMDGTLLDSSSVVERVWRAWAQRHDVDPEPLLAACHGVQGADTIRRFGGPDLDVAAEARWLDQAEMADVEGLVAIEGVLAVVQTLEPRSWAIVTSASRELARRRLSAVALPLPEVMVAAEDVESGKPDPEGFLRAAELLGVTVSDCLLFEDSPAGVAAARAAGGQVVIVGSRVAAEEGEFAISNYL
jgi:sugar-phosphatase